jgi:hypothetical protein
VGIAVAAATHPVDADIFVFGLPRELNQEKPMPVYVIADVQVTDAAAYEP